MSWLTETFSDAFARRALLEAVLVGGVCGVIGVHVLLRRLPFFTMALGHATFPGVVLAALLGANLFLGATLFGAVVVLVVALLGARQRIDETSAIGVALSGAFALGVLLLSAQSGFTRDHKELVLGAFDRDGLTALGYPVLALDVAVLLLIEVTLVTSIPAVGTILAVALIVAPAAAARLWTERLGATMALAAGIGIASGIVGLAISQHWKLAAGATIVLVATGLFMLSFLAAPHHGVIARQRARRRRPEPLPTAAGSATR